MKKLYIVKSAIVLGMAIILLCGTLLYAGIIPKSEKEIPVLGGSVRDSEKESVSKNQMGWENNPNLRNTILKIYNTNISVEEVFNYYRQKIGGDEEPVNIDPGEIRRGAVSKVWCEYECYTDEDFRDYEIDSGIRHPGTWMKQKLTENRKSRQPGQWIKEAKFNWYYKENNGDLTTFYLIISDNSFAGMPEKYKTNTGIEIQITTEKSDQAVREESDEQMDKQIEQRAISLKNKPPAAKELGVPIYPGAKYDAEASAGMSSGNDYVIHIYLTTDEPAKVVGFYEKQLKVNAAETVNGRYLIPLKGKMPLPEEGISIEPNTMFGGNAKCVISIQKILEKK